MTETRKYFEKLISLYDELCKVKEDEVIKFLKLKTKLYTLLTEIQNYRLLEIDLPQRCIEILSDDENVNILEEQKLLALNLSDQLCSLIAGKIWYGGELLYHLNRIQISSYHLPTQIQEVMEVNEGTDVDGIKLRVRLHNKQDKTDAITKRKEKNLVQFKSTQGKYKAIPKEIYKNVSTQLENKISAYRSYINLNYPTISDHFNYNKKLVNAYLCDERKDVIVCRIQSYYDQTDRSVNLNKSIFDFCPRPPYNFEKVSSKLKTWSWFGINKSDWKIPESTFSITSIHRELLSLYLINADENEIVNFIIFLMRSSLNKVEEYKSEKSFLKINNDTSNELIKIIHRDKLSTEFINDTIQKLEEIFPDHDKKVLFFSKPDDLIIKEFEKNGIKINYSTEYTDVQFENSNSELIHLFIKSRLQSHLFKNPKVTDNGIILIKELKDCPLGKEGWPKFENVAARIFKYLFSESFLEFLFETQSSNDEDSLRRDMIVHNNYKEPTSFWARVKTDYAAKLIIVEFKNYKDQLNYDTLFSTTKYLKNKVGNVVILFSRKGGKEKLVLQQKEMMQEGKLILCFDEKELIEMIEEKLTGTNPEYRFDLKLFELLKK